MSASNPRKGGDQVARGKSSAADKWVMGILASILVSVGSKLFYDWITGQRQG
jgi:hypothetical protein